MAINSKRKGKEGENEISRYLRDYGYDAHRSVQYCGANGDADVVGLDGIHIEVKRVERLMVYDAMNQAIRDARKDEIPVVMYRRNKAKWLAILRLDDFMELYQAWEGEDETEE